MKEQTLSIIKPDATEKNHIGAIISYLEKASLRVVAAKMLHLTKEEAGKFYEIHKGKPFYDELCEFMSSGRIVAMVLEGKNAVEQNRKVMGNTDPKKADAGTIRKDFAEEIGRNAVHGSDSKENAVKEISFFFSSAEICL